MSETNDAKVEQVGQALMVQLDGGREIHAARMSDGTFTFLFINNGDKTMIRLSREAINAMRGLLMQHTRWIDA